MSCYQSTRNQTINITETEAILQGISKEGGLFVPKELPKMDFELNALLDFNYQTLAYRVIRLFFDNLKEEDLKGCIAHAYDEKFDTPMIAPVKTTQTAHFLELFHGPTLAFKDMALSILPYLMTTSKRYEQEDKEIIILTATSGDTGKAALEGFADVPGTKIIVFFPEEGVSDVQKRQMTTQKGENTLVVGIKGNFDDAQTGVKQIFADQAFEAELAAQGFVFSSANSINIGRLVPQVVYYFYAYGRLAQEGSLQVGEPMNVVVPTGNFGNILAAYYAKCMGLPIGKFICASNKNNVLTDFFEKGIYDRRRDFFVTNSPSMDILISSNLERFLYYMCEGDTTLVTEFMEDLRTKGYYKVTEKMQEKMQLFEAGFADDETTLAMIKKVYEEENYLMDTHTAVAYAVYDSYKTRTKDLTPTVIASTASPYKFTGSVMCALDKKYETQNDFVLLKEMEKLLNNQMPEGIRGIETLPIRHQCVCEVTRMKETIADFLK
ncbi:MAG: threonine synthase [Niameybacter sp.]|uniref:threonine synthase n=1 Tax=Niameybacter sp. TaxID=2033640 RepID=UPI002FCB0381